MSQLDFPISHFKVRVWTAIHVSFFLVLGFLIARGDYEERIYKELVDHVSQSDPSMSRQDLAVQLTHTVHDLLAPRTKVWGHPVGGAYETMFSSISQELNVPQGSCESFSLVLVKTLQAAGYPARFAQMTTSSGIKGAHSLAEAEVAPGRWAVLDSSFDICFYRPDGRLASFADVRSDFGYYEKQLPANWPAEFRFDDVRYTNWEKIPFIMPAAHKLFSLVMPADKLRTFCLRASFTNLFYLDALIVSLFYILLLLGRVFLPSRIAWLRNRFPRKLAPALLGLPRW